MAFIQSSFSFSSFAVIRYVRSCRLTPKQYCL